MITTIIRIALSIILLYLAYGETGIATTIILFLLLLNSEATALIFKKQRELDGELGKTFSRILKK